jgi:hypothetical protein
VVRVGAIRHGEKAVLRREVKKTDRNSKGPVNKKYKGFLTNGTVATHL